jgi:hypothetical protein
VRLSAVVSSFEQIRSPHADRDHWAWQHWLARCRKPHGRQSERHRFAARPGKGRLATSCLKTCFDFYIVFSNSIQRGRAEAEISVLGPDGEPAPDVLYRAPIELWDRSMQCLTILLDPGRLKRGVGPNRERGPALKVGEAYTLAVGVEMTDSRGRPLRETVYKRFSVTEAVREPVAVERWKVQLPEINSLQPLVLLFKRPLDWGLLLHTITVMSPDGKSLDGKVVIDQCERRWAFTPAAPWIAGSSQLRVASDLEDVCGNDLVAAFDRPLRPGSNLAYEVTGRSSCIYLA